MTVADANERRALATPSFAVCLLILSVLTLIRLVGLRWSVVDLFFDEAQYWAWSRELAFGYFSKPPLLAWIIAGAERICGDSEACLRAPAPIFYLGTSLLTYAIGRALYDARVAFWSALVIASAPGVVFSARIISTDVPLLFFWALALLAYVKLWQRAATAKRGVREPPGAMTWGVVLGLALGFGMLAKYAMGYFVLGAAIAAFIDRDARAMLRRPEPWLALLIGVIVLSPNIWWNIDNGFATLRHTGDNIQGSGIALSPFKGLEFIASQFGVIGPVIFAMLLVLLTRMASPTVSRADSLMLAFAIPALALVTATGFITRANANWAAPSFVSAVIVVTAVLVRRAAWRWIAAGIALGAVAQVALLIGDSLADRLSVPGLAKPDLYARTLGWRALGDAAGRLAERAGARTIVAEQRDDEASLMYYQRNGGRPVLAWPTGPTPEHQFDLTRRFTAGAPAPALFITHCGATERLTRQFAQVEPLGGFAAPTGPTTTRDYVAFKLSAPRGAIVPLGPCR